MDLRTNKMSGHARWLAVAEFDHLDFSAEAQTEAVMERLQKTVRAAGGELNDIVQVTRFVVDIGENQVAVIPD